MQTLKLVFWGNSIVVIAVLLSEYGLVYGLLSSLMAVFQSGLPCELGQAML